MRVRIGDDRQVLLAAKRPQPREGIAVQHADAGVVGVGIELVVVDAVAHLLLAGVIDTEQERAGLVAALARGVRVRRRCRARAAANSAAGAQAPRTPE